MLKGITYFLFCMSLGCLLCSARSIVHLGSKLSVEEDNSWVSSNGDFAVGFFKWANQYSVGIRFNSISIPSSQQEVVWVAGCDIQVSSNSTFELTENGGLLLYDFESGKIAWSSNTSNTPVASATLDDDGNLILVSKEGVILWESFKTPCDTLLPGQYLSPSMTLRPHKRDGVSSYYSLYMDNSGQLQLRWETSVMYWKNKEPSQSGLRAGLSFNGIFEVFDNNSKSLWSAYGADHNDSDIKFRFLRLDADGNLRLYSWLEALKSWRNAWQAVENECEVFAICADRGICVFNASGSHICRCQFSSIGQSTSECLVPYRQGCKSGYSMIAQEHTMLYGYYPPNETIIQTSLRQCKILCQEDPLCTAVSFKNDGSAQCRIKRTRYISGWSDASLNVVSFVKTCSDPIAVLPPRSSSSGLQKDPLQSERICLPCLIGAAAGTFVLFFCIQFGIGLCMWKRKKHLKKKAAQSFIFPYSKGCVALSYSEILDLTENFKYQIGPKMFRGLLPNNQSVAVKKLDSVVPERKFRGRVLKIGSIYHKNLVKLDGYCCDSGQRYIAYEFVMNGSLRECLEDPRMSKKLTWRKRMDICLAVARVISYLHTECREFVSHGNLKCENVVLDNNLEAKVSEFGLKSVSGGISNIEGTAEMDVKNFGKMVVELISGCTNDASVCEWAYERWVRAETDMIPDTRMVDGVNSDELERALRIAFWCLQIDDRMRPSMGEVVQVLEGTSTVDPPPDPFGNSHQMLLKESSESNLEV